MPIHSTQEPQHQIDEVIDESTKNEIICDILNEV
jgi:hypothetical protein